MNDTVRQLRDFCVSLKLSVVLLVLGMVLVFADRQPTDLCKTYGFEPFTIHGDPLGVRLV